MRPHQFLSQAAAVAFTDAQPNLLCEKTALSSCLDKKKSYQEPA